MFEFLFMSKRKMLLYIFLFVLLMALIDYFNQQQKDAEWDRNVMEERSSQDNWQRENNQTIELTPEQKQRQKDALKNGLESTEPLPSEVKPEDEEMYNWIMDHPDYNGDYEYFQDLYESQYGDYDDYEK